MASTSRKLLKSSPLAPATPRRPMSDASRKRAKLSPASSSPASVFLLSGHVLAVKPNEIYQDLGVSAGEFRPSATLTTGQCFHWKVVEKGNASPDKSPSSAWGSHDASEWVGVLRLAEKDESIVVSIQETSETTLFRTLYAPPGVDVRKVLYDYFQLNVRLEPLYQKWSAADPSRLARIATCIRGVRIVEQDPWECLVSFICSSNNNIPRITKMLTAIRRKFGSPLVTIGDEILYSFPSLETLHAEATESTFREIGLGYRAKYLIQTMETLRSLGGEPYLMKLRQETDPVSVQEKLIQFAGVGRKVADCVALFSLCQCNAIPVDVHVWNIARRDYDPEGALTDVKSLTPTIYRQVGDLFRRRFPDKAGWAHSLLFVAELPSFRPVLPSDMVEEMGTFRKLEQERKQAAKAAKQDSKK